MAKHTLDDDRPGYYLPEDSQQRLVRLSDHIKFLLRLMQPLVDAADEPVREVRMGEVAFCLELLGDQVDLVLDEVSWPARRAMQASASARDAVDEALGYTFGVTLAQIDTLDGLVRTLAAHGDVLAGSDAAGLAGGTLPSMGRAVFDAAAAVRGVLDEVETQRLAAGADARFRVGEARAVYAVPRALPARLSTDQVQVAAELSYGDYLH
ncbi:MULTISPECIES: XAC0095 family protein [Stenotrophomonas]|uniref:XAC0095-like domain-containing protein n=1 Tax=Stenotrophomonas nitritireducens TaxID=83617 RepID=A0ABR5NKM3_9GAMM|nr:MULTISPECIES: hypothetical protein [Stenotrophomonas]KRG58029.1 hypothetical protein ABB22_07765 [Stenotrophomonas nitritireducens]